MLSEKNMDFLCFPLGNRMDKDVGELNSPLMISLRKDRSRLDLRKFTFSQRVVDMWNHLPAEVVTASSVKVFKNKLEAHLKNLPRRSPE